jgi:putative transposase
MEKVGRQKRSESVWREIVARQAQSGLAVREFCEREGIKAPSLYGWRVRLREDTQEHGVRPTAAKTERAEKSSGEFIDLGALGSGHSRFEVRLELGGGVLLHLVRS